MISSSAQQARGAGGDVAVRQAAGDLEPPVQVRGGQRLAFQDPGQRVDLGVGPGPTGWPGCGS